MRMHKRFKYYFILLYLLIAYHSNSQQTEYRVTNYDETTGLQSNVINTMLQDSQGYLWFGTADGLCRYDGYNFKTFRRTKEKNSLPGNYVLKLAEDKNKKIWIGLLRDGISCYDPAAGTFTNYNVSNIDSTAPLARAVDMLFIDSENNVWAGVFQKGLIKIDRATKKIAHYNVIPDTSTMYSRELRANYNSVYDMREDDNGMYWLATHDGLYRFNKHTGSMQAIRTAPVQKNVLRDDLFRSMIKDKNGLWFGSWAGGLSYYDSKTKQWSNYKYSKRYKNVATTNVVVNITAKNQNEIWLATLDKGLGTFNKITHQFYFFRDDSSIHSLLPGKAFFAVMQDKQNNVWVSHDAGLTKIQQNQKSFVFMPAIRTSHNAGFSVTSMLEDRQHKYLFTGTSFGDGLRVSDVYTGKTQSVSFGIMQNEESMMQVSDMIQDSKGNVWILTRDYIYQYDELSNKLIYLPQPALYTTEKKSNYFSAIREDKKGRIWIATNRNGVFCYNPTTKEYQHFYNDASNKKSLPSNVIPALAVDGKNRVWIGGGRGCFGYFDSAQNFVSIDENAKPSRRNFNARIETLYADKDGDIWCGTEGGLFYYNAHSDIIQLKKFYNADNGLRGDLSTYIHEDNSGYIWCVTGSAVCKINKQTGSITAFGKLDGIDNASAIGGIYLFGDGKMALYTYGGYYIFNPSECNKKNTTAPVAITAFKIDDKEQFYQNIIASGKKVIVPASANVISFEFAALDFNRPDKQMYAYKLEGFDKDWVMSGQRRFAGYGNIPGGDYIFKVKATNTPDDWNVPIVSIPIHIEQPFYKTWWFIAIVAVVTALLLYTFYVSRIKKHKQIHELETKAQKLEKEKALVMYESLKQQLNPHFLFNSLTSLSSLIRYDQKQAGDFLDGLSRIYRYILKSRNHETVSLIEEIKFVQTFIKLQRTRFDHGFTVNIHVDDAFHDCKIVPVTLQNLIENAIKHNIIDDESPLIIDIYNEEEYVVVRNNLQKKNNVETSNKQGLINMKTLYYYLSDKPVIITEDKDYFFVKIPML